MRLAAAGADIIGVDLCEQVSSDGYLMSTPGDWRRRSRRWRQSGRRIIAGKRTSATRVPCGSARRGVAELGRLDSRGVANADIMPIWGERAQTMQAWHDFLDVLLTGVLHAVELSYPIIWDISVQVPRASVTRSPARLRLRS